VGLTPKFTSPRLCPYGILRTSVLQPVIPHVGGVPINNRIENVKDKVILFRPIYTDEGNVTELFINSNGQIATSIDYRNITSVRPAFARSFALDLSAQGQILKEKFNRHFPLPFYLPDNRVFIPLKMRKARIVGDSTYGYVDINHIQTVNQQGKAVNLTLASGLKIPLYTSATVARNNINIGKEIASTICNKEDTEEARVLEAVNIIVKKIYNIEQLLQKVL
jgi:hypothetical protein